MFLSDWSSDVCSSDLSAIRRRTGGAGSSRLARARTPHQDRRHGDRKCGGEGKREDVGGRRVFKKKEGIRCSSVTGVQTCALPIYQRSADEREAQVVRGSLERGHHTGIAGMEIGSAAGRERGKMSVGAVSLKKKRAFDVPQ